MLKTSEKIRNEALEQFNEHGFFSVSLRSIAISCNMSVGNLNYHFKQREDLLRSLYFEMVADFDQRLEADIPKDLDRKALEHIIQNSMQRMYNYRFFWTDLYRLLQIDSDIAVHFQKVHLTRLQGNLDLQKLLEQKGLVHSISSQKQDWTAHRMLDYSNSWLYLLQMEPQLDKKPDAIEKIIRQKARNLADFLPWKEH